MMRASRATRSLALALPLALLPFSAAESSGDSLVGTSTTAFGLESASRFYVHWVNPRYWIAFHNGTAPVLYSSPDATTWTSQGAIFSSFNPPANQGLWAIRYEGTNIIALGFNTVDSNRYYRNGTLNNDGTVTWNAPDAVAQAAATPTQFNALVANQKPLYWRAALGSGQLALGTQLNAPTWSNPPLPPSMAAITGGTFTAGALFATGGSDPDDLIVLRATTQAAYAAGNHRLVAVKFDASLNAHDAAWYNVSTLNGGLTEDATTEVKPGTDGEVHQRFAAVRDTSGDLHAVYVNGNDDVAHYRKAVGFNDTWAQVSSDVTVSAAVIDRVALTALVGGQLLLFYSKSDDGIYYRRWDGATWGIEATLKSASATPLQGALASIELADGCAVALAWSEGTASPFDVRFQTLPAGCGQMLVKSGFYTGNAVNGRAIWVGFQPDVVFVKADSGSEGGALRTSTMVGDVSKNLDTGATSANLIESLTSQGFTVGNDAAVNDSGPYYWVAFMAAPGQLKVGTYTGTGIDPTSIPGVGFQPEYVITLPDVAGQAVSSSSTMPADTSYQFQDNNPDPFTNRIQAFQPDGFQVGNATNVNTASATYHYIAWNVVPGRVAVGSYVGNGVDDRDLDVLTFQPEWVLVKRPTNAGWRHKPASSGNNTNYSLVFGDSAGSADDIQQLRPLGFQVSFGPEATCRTNQNLITYHWIAFGPRPPTINYRSIGTAGAYGTGTISVTNGSSIVTGAGGATWQAANRGRGDVITIPCSDPPACLNGAAPDGTHYTVNSVGSETSLELTPGYVGATASGLTYLIRRQFSMLSDWEDCVDGPPGAACPYFPVSTSSLVTDDRSEVGIAYKDTEFDLTADVVINGSTTDAIHTIKLTADGTNRHNGTPGAGVVVDGQNGQRQTIIQDSNVTIEWLEFMRVRGGFTAAVRVNGAAGDVPINVRIQNVLIHDFDDAANEVSGIRLSGTAGKSVTIRNCMLWDGDKYGIEGGAVGDTVVIENCSLDFMNNDGTGIHALNSAMTVRNTIVTRSANAEYDTNPGGSLTGSNNTSDDGSAATYFANPITGVSAAAIFVVPNLNLHLLAGPQVDSGLNLSPSFANDIDGALRPVGLGWDRGADEFGVTTAVELQSFWATSLDSAVDLAWTTASELQNLGFHLYRADTASGPYARITSSLISGLGSSPTGQSYSYRDAGLVNGRTYYYELEDIETTGGTERHGPVSATPGTTSGGSDTPPGSTDVAGTIYGDPSSVVLREVERSPSHVVLELLTGGFVASPAEEGRVRLRIPGFESVSRPGEPSLPMRRTLVEAASGKKVRVASILASDEMRFPGLRPVSQGMPGIEVSEEGVILPSEEKRRDGPGFGGLFPAESALLGMTSFQGETKKAEVLLFPLRWDGSGLTLSRRLLVRLEFSGTEDKETSRGGSRGRRRVERESHAQTGVVAQVVVKEKGLQRVDYEDVFGAAARRRGLPESSLRLSRQGKSVAFHVEPQGALFGPGSSLYFLSEGPDLNSYGDAVYELETNTTNRRLRMEVESLSSTSGEVSEHFPEVRLEENHYYQAGLLEAPDLWLWDLVVSPGSKSFSFTVSELATSSSVGRLSVVMQGASDFPAVPDHHVKVKVNGILLGETTWDGRLPETLEVEVPPGVLLEGANSLELEDVGDAGAAYSMVFLNRFSLSYPRRLVATQGKLEGRFESSGQAEIEGASPSSFVLDTTDVPRWLVGASATTNGLSRSVQAGRSYLLTSTSLRPEVRRLQASSLKSTTNRADYLFLGSQAFLGVAQPLLDLRESQGLATKAVSLEEVYEQFGYGEVSPEAIKEFLEFAYHFWAGPSPRYVLLLGDASYDPKDYLGTGVKDRLPGFPVETSYLWTVSDPAYASVNGEDLLPDLAIGRLPAGSVDEAQRLVQKVIAFENGGGHFDGPAVLVSDNADLAANFEADADEIASTIMVSRSPTKIYYSQEGANTRTRIEEAFDAGASLMSYMGHGGTVVWASENIFNYQDVQTLAPQPQQPLLMTMNCLNGFFHFPPLNSLSEALLKAEGKGVVGAFSPSGLSINDAAHLLHKALLEEIVSGRHERIGDAVLAAQARYSASGAFPELLSIYHLFGDPALKLR